jgi:hypothetical protein
MTAATQPTRSVTKMELAVLGAIVLGGLVLLLPALSASRDTARANLCRRNLRWMDLATRDYLDAQQRLPNALTWPYDLLARYQDGLGSNRRPSGLTAVTTPRPMILTCPARPNVAAQDGTTQPVHYTLVVDRDQPSRSHRATWKYRDRPLVIDEAERKAWYTGHELTPAQSEEQIQSSIGPHAGGAYLESDSLGSSVVRQGPRSTGP